MVSRSWVGDTSARDGKPVLYASGSDTISRDSREPISMNSNGGNPAALGLTAILVLALSGGYAQTASISGIVVDASGDPVTGSLVSAVRWTPPPSIRRGTTGARGEFLISPVEFQILDPARVLANSPQASVLVGVTGQDRVFRSAILVSSDGAGRVYRSLLPYDVPVKAVVAGSVRFSDDAGNPAPDTTVVPVIAKRGASVGGIRLRVTGLRP